MNSTYLLTTGLGFVFLTALSFGILLRHLARVLSNSDYSTSQQKRIKTAAMLAIIGWAFVLAIISWSGFSQKFHLFPLNIAPILIVPLVTIVWVTFSNTTKQLLPLIPARHLIRLQVFRVAVEILLWLLFLQNMLPVQMTFEGRNFDVMAGITAPLVAYLFSDNKKILLIWNLVCRGLLINIVGTAILSMPTPIQVFENEPANTIVAVFPFIFLPGFLVPLAYGLHFLSLRKLFLKPD